MNDADLPNAVALNSTSFNAARLIGPAVAGVLIAAVGSGWFFLINAASFAAVLFSLCLLQTAHLQIKPKALRPTKGVTTTANSVLQLSTEPFMRGRIIAMFMAIALGTTPIGAPIVGWIADHFGARWALGAGAASGFAAAIVGIYYLMRAEDAFPPLEECRTG